MLLSFGVLPLCFGVVSFCVCQWAFPVGFQRWVSAFGFCCWKRCKSCFLLKCFNTQFDFLIWFALLIRHRLCEICWRVSAGTPARFCRRVSAGAFPLERCCWSVVQDAQMIAKHVCTTTQRLQSITHFHTDTFDEIIIRNGNSSNVVRD